MKVSVIIPTYNRAALLIETLQAALAQTFEDREIIVVDDGSTDDTRTVLEPYLDKLTYVCQDNQGVNAARNFGLSVAQGEYVALLDSDDIWQPFLLELFVRVLEENPGVGFVYSDFALLKPDGTTGHNVLKTWYTRENDWDRLFATSEPLSLDRLPPSMSDVVPADAKLFFGDIYHASLYHPAVLPSASLFRRSMAPAERPFNEGDSTCGDWEFFARLSRGHGAAFLDLEAAFNRSHDDAVRLMRLDLAIRLKRRIRFVERLWQADPEFMRNHADEVYDVLYSLYTLLIKVQLVGGDRVAAKATVRELRASDACRGGLKYQVLNLLASVPGSAAALHAARRLRDRLIDSGR